MSDEYTVERQYRYVNCLANGDVLLSTEYNSLLSEAMLIEATREQLTKACRKLIRQHQRLRIRIEVLTLEEPGHGQEAKVSQ